MYVSVSYEKEVVGYKETESKQHLLSDRMSDWIKVKQWKSITLHTVSMMYQVKRGN